MSLLVLPMLAYTSIVAKEDTQTTLTSMVGYLSAMSMGMGGLFKLMHWPGAMLLFWSGVLVLLLGFMPLNTIRS